MLCMMGALIYRLGTLTIKEGEKWAQTADSRSTQTIAIKGERGEEVRCPADQNLHRKPRCLEKRRVKLDEGD